MHLLRNFLDGCVPLRSIGEWITLALRVLCALYTYAYIRYVTLRSYVHTYIHKYINNYLPTCLPTYVRTYIHTYKYVCIYTYIYI